MTNYDCFDELTFALSRAKSIMGLITPDDRFRDMDFEALASALSVVEESIIKAEQSAQGIYLQNTVRAA